MKLFTLMQIISLGVTGFECPDESVIKPCSCEYIEYRGSILECKNFENLDDLQKVFDESLDYNFNELELADCVIPYMNTTWFSTKRMNEVSIYRMTLIDLIDNMDMVVPSLTYIAIFDTTIIRGLRWQQFRPFNNLEYMIVHNKKIKKLGKEFRNNVPSSLMFLNIDGNLKVLEDKDFQGKTKLRHIILDSNKIRVLKNSFFKDQRNILEQISFSNNPIESLPEDLFEGMSSLKNADFRGAQIKTLSTNLFPAKSKIIFDFRENPLVCDCKMSWIPKRSQDMDLTGTCESPPFLKSRDLKDLAKEDFKACVNYLKLYSPSVLLTNVSLYFDYFL